MPSTRERVILVTMALVILFMGVASPLFTRRMEACDKRAAGADEPAARKARNRPASAGDVAATRGLQFLPARRHSTTDRRYAGASVMQISAEQLTNSQPARAGNHSVRVRHSDHGARSVRRAARQTALGWVRARRARLLRLFAIRLAAIDPGLAYSGLIRADPFSIFVHVVVIGAAALAILGSCSYLDDEGLQRGEYYALVLFRDGRHGDSGGRKRTGDGVCRAWK